MKKITLTAVALLATLAGQSANAQTCPSQAQSHVATVAQAPHDNEKTIVETAVAAGKFNTLVAAVKAAGLVETLQGKGPFTVLAPSDEAFAKLPKGTIEELLKPENKDQLVSILTYHVIPANVTSDQVVKLPSADSVQGQKINIKVADGKVMLNDATVTAVDIACSNGTIHVIDTVLIPKQPSDIVDTAVGAGSFNTLAAALKAAGLVETLKGEGPFTVFAPTDEAFAKLPAGTVETLLKPENKDKLVSILTYHVVPGKVKAADVAGLLEEAAKNNTQSAMAKTVQGSEIKFSSADGKVMINEANVVTTDIDCSNGVIHVIDSVILPK